MTPSGNGRPEPPRLFPLSSVSWDGRDATIMSHERGIRMAWRAPETSSTQIGSLRVPRRGKVMKFRFLGAVALAMIVIVSHGTASRCLGQDPAASQALIEASKRLTRA